MKVIWEDCYTASYTLDGHPNLLSINVTGCNPEAKSVAHLLEAAPSMLAALRMLLAAPALNEDVIDALDIEFIGKAQAAIAKATGEST